MPFVEDLTVFFEDFGVTATPGVGSDITVIFDRAHIEAMGGDISSTRPIALAMSADVSTFVANSTTLTVVADPAVPATALIAGNYTVRDIEPDGTGLSLLILEAN